MGNKTARETLEQRSPEAECMLHGPMVVDEAWNYRGKRWICPTCDRFIISYLDEEGK